MCFDGSRWQSLTHDLIGQSWTVGSASASIPSKPTTTATAECNVGDERTLLTSHAVEFSVCVWVSGGRE